MLLKATVALAGPISEYYITAAFNSNVPDEGKIYVIQGNSVVRDWNQIDPGDAHPNEYPIAVLTDPDPGIGGYVRTSSARAGTPGREYYLDGAYTSTSFPYPGTITEFYDGTTDGTYNYGYDFVAGKMYRMGLDWQNPTLLFSSSTGSPSRLGVTYDWTNNSLWVSDWSSTFISNFAMDGTLLYSFSTGVENMTGLALDPADGTLWFGTQSDLSNLTRTLYQYSKGGASVSTATYDSLQYDDYLGGEFAFDPALLAAIPEPATFATGSLLAFAGICASLWRRRRSR